MPAAHRHQKIQLALLFIAVVLLLVVLCIGRVAEIVIIASLLAYLLDPVMTRLELKGVSRGNAAALIMLLITGIFAIFWYAVIPLALHQIDTLRSGSGLSRASDAIVGLEELLHRHGGIIGLGDIKLMQKIAGARDLLLQEMPAFLMKGSPSLLIGLAMIPFIMFFLLKDMRSFKKYFISLVPNPYFEFTLNLLYKMELQLGNYLRGQVIDAAIFGILATSALWLLDVPYFIVIGIFSGLANLIPFVGPVAGTCLAMIVVILYQGDIMRAFNVALVFVFLKLVDDFVVQPLAVGRNVDLHPMVVALAIIVGGHLFGVLGMVLVVPFIGFLKVMIEESFETLRGYRFD